MNYCINKIAKKREKKPREMSIIQIQLNVVLKGMKVLSNDNKIQRYFMKLKCIYMHTNSKEIMNIEKKN